MAKARSLLIVGIMLLSVLAVAVGAAPLVANGGFENGDLFDWQYANDAFVTPELLDLGGFSTVLPTEGDYFGVVTNGTGSYGLLLQPIFIGDRYLRFDWNFFSAEPDENYPNSDQFDVLIFPGSSPVSLFHMDAGSVAWSNSGNPPSGYAKQTGWHTSTVDLEPWMGKTLNIAFIVSDAGDPFVDSGVALDNMDVVPEPGSLLALCTGMVGLLGTVVRRKR